MWRFRHISRCKRAAFRNYSMVERAHGGGIVVRRAAVDAAVIGN